LLLFGHKKQEAQLSSLSGYKRKLKPIRTFGIMNLNSETRHNRILFEVMKQSIVLIGENVILPDENFSSKKNRAD